MKIQPVGADTKTERSVEGRGDPHLGVAQHGVEQPVQPFSGEVIRLCHVGLQCRPGWC